MRFVLFEQSEKISVAAGSGDAWFDVDSLDLPFNITPNNIAILTGEQLATLASAISSTGVASLALGSLTLLPPIATDARIFCVGLNYADHADESKMEHPAYPVVFLRTRESFVGHDQPLILPRVSAAFDYEGEMVAVLKQGGRYIDTVAAAECVGGYTVANEGSIRDYQLQRGPQWTMGKNFNASGAIGPCFVTADELPPLGKGLAIRTRVNGEIVQESNTRNMIFDIAQIISYLSEAFVLKAGDVIVSGTPAGVGAARKPPLWVKAGDFVEVEVEAIGRVRNRVVQED
ncbi:fumarylacetoacetate hydrolase family protein [Caballeronia sp. 15711]|uniref:fumarylacetoacetate hydrolase family protein n=1 Tax=Caballeronia sp. 15711 TaxID=3391029 RepID=UPI0039E688AF